MTLVDTIFVVLAALQVIAIGVMIWVGLAMMDTAKKGQKAMQPTLDEVKAVTEAGTTIATHAKEKGMAALNRVKAVAGVVKKRIGTTVRVAKELKPGAEEAATGIQQHRESALGTAQKVGEIARGLGRVRAAAEAASRARQES
jgi:hypothetical protein